MRDDDRTVRTLRDLVEFSEASARLVARGREAYDGDETLRLAAEALLLRIGEAVGRLPTDVTDAHPDVPWRAMRGMRNIVAHQYQAVDHDIVWNALTGRLPEAAAVWRAMLPQTQVEGSE